MKRTALRPVSAKRARHLRVVRDEPGREEWKQPASGYCWCGCETWAPRLHRHHVLLESRVRLAGGDPWSPLNQFLIAPDCHELHHRAARKIRLEVVPHAAIRFAYDLLGEGPAASYFASRYEQLEVQG